MQLFPIMSGCVVMLLECAPLCTNLRQKRYSCYHLSMNKIDKNKGESSSYTTIRSDEWIRVQVKYSKICHTARFMIAGALLWWAGVFQWRVLADRKHTVLGRILLSPAVYHSLLGIVTNQTVTVWQFLCPRISNLHLASKNWCGGTLHINHFFC